MFNNKKGMTWQQIVLAVIAVVVVVVVVMFFRSGSEKGFGFAEGKIGELGDCDKDGVADLYDKCDCDPDVGDEWTAAKNNSKQCTPLDGDAKCLCKQES
jgi:hypothetical protein